MTAYRNQLGLPVHSDAWVFVWDASSLYFEWPKFTVPCWLRRFEHCSTLAFRILVAAGVPIERVIANVGLPSGDCPFAEWINSMIRSFLLVRVVKQAHGPSHHSIRVFLSEDRRTNELRWL